jgi:hypothetical protein
LSITPADGHYQTTDSHFKEKWRRHDKQIAMDMGAGTFLLAVNMFGSRSAS